MIEMALPDLEIDICRGWPLPATGFAAGSTIGWRRAVSSHSTPAPPTLEGRKKVGRPNVGISVKRKDLRLDACAGEAPSEVDPTAAACTAV